MLSRSENSHLSYRELTANQIGMIKRLVPHLDVYNEYYLRVTTQSSLGSIV